MFEQNQPFKFNFSNDVELSDNLSRVEPQNDQSMPAKELIFPTQVISITPLPDSWSCSGVCSGLILLYLCFSRNFPIIGQYP